MRTREIITMMMLLIMIIPVAHAASVSRAFSSADVAPQGSIAVTLKIDVDDPAPSGLIVEEAAPAGWGVSDASEGGMISGNTIKWLRNALMGKPVQDMKLTYVVTAPAAAGKGTFSGKMKIPPATEDAIIGDSSVTVAAAQVAPAPAPAKNVICTDSDAYLRTREKIHAVKGVAHGLRSGVVGDYPDECLPDGRLHETYCVKRGVVGISIDCGIYNKVCIGGVCVAEDIEPEPVVAQEPQPEPAPAPELSPLEEAMIGKPFLPPALMEYLQRGTSQPLMTQSCQGGNCNLIKFSCGKNGLIQKEVVQCNACTNGACNADAPLVGKADAAPALKAAAPNFPWFGQACKTNKDCPSKNCDFKTKTCGLVRERNKCDSDEICQSGYCDRICKKKSVGMKCTDTKQCNRGACVGGICLGNKGTVCDANENCATGYCNQRCDLKPVKMECATNEQCKTGQCIGGRCTGKATGEACTLNKECFTGYCQGEIIMENGQFKGYSPDKKCKLIPNLKHIKCDIDEQCVLGACLADNTCGLRAAGAECADPTLELQVQLPWLKTANDMCQQKMCKGGKCTGKEEGQQCMFRHECNSGWCNTFVQPNVCAKMPVGSELCKNGNMCQSGICNKVGQNEPCEAQGLSSDATCVCMNGPGDPCRSHTECTTLQCDCPKQPGGGVRCIDENNQRLGTCTETKICKDNDNLQGNNPVSEQVVTKAIATLGLGEERIEDTCSREVFNQLDEAVCEGGVPKLTPVDCAQFTNSEGNGGYCEEGRCIIPPEPIPCTDNDADQGDIQAQAMVRSTTEIGVGESYEDQCAGVEGKENYVQERTCFQGMVGFEEFNCEESGMVCRDGACVEAPPEEPAPVEAVEDPAAEAAPAPAAAQTGGVCDEKGKRQKIGASFHECYDVSGALQWRILLKQACVSSNQCIPNAECQNSMCLGSAGTLCGNDASLCVKGLECSSEQKCVAPAAPSPAPAAGGAGGGVAPPAPGKCEIPGDKDPCDGKIDDLELSMYIGWWLKADQDPMNDLKLSQAIGAWLKG